MTSTEKLVAELTKANAPARMIDKAKAGDYNDYQSSSATPITDLVRDCIKASFAYPALAEAMTKVSDAAKEGAFDATKEESDAWAKEAAKDPELGPILKKLGLLPK